ncbi:MAG: hypothetical protein WCC67_21055, partial [Candidatus Acidiferrales bacterium]
MQIAGVAREHGAGEALPGAWVLECCLAVTPSLTLEEFVRQSQRETTMRIHFTRAAKILGGALFALGLFASGYVAGQNRFNQPKTILHVVELKWNPAATDADKQRAIEGIKDMAAKIPGIKNIWIKGERMQPRDFNAAYAIEFRDRAAADA